MFSHMLHTIGFQGHVLALDDSVLYVDQVENLIKFCPTKEEMDQLKVSSLCFSCQPELCCEGSTDNLATIYVYLSYNHSLYAGIHWR